MIPDESFFQLLESRLSGLVPGEPVEVVGEWSTTTRKTYLSQKEEGSGTGPFVEVEDRRWKGTLSSRTTVTGINFLATATKVYWAKASALALTLPVDVSLHAYAGRVEGRATFTAGIGGAGLPGVPVAAPTNLYEVCAPGPRTLSTGRVVTLARVDGVAFVALILPDTVVRMGRNHLWRLREQVASSLPKEIRELLTRRRSGEIHVAEAGGRELRR
jgi:hypothetical protein